MEFINSGSVLFPFIAFLGCWLVLRRRGQDRRTSLLVSATLWGLCIVATTELLSVGALLTRPALAVTWLLVSIPAWRLAILAPKRGLARSDPAEPPDLQAPHRLPLSSLYWLLLAGLVGILSILGIIAFAAPPNSWDAMQYNMPRMVMWIENRSVHFYPTVDYQQLMMSPWSEYAATQLTILLSSDRFVPLVEWFAFLGSILGVSLIARELGAGPRGQVLAAVLSGTLPQAILAATSAKPDVAVAFWIVAACFFLLRYKSHPVWSNALLAGAAIGLATLTKGTAFILLPALVLSLFFLWPADTRKRFIVRVPAVLALALALNAPQFYRNVRLSGSPLGFASPDGDADTAGRRHFANAKFGPRDIAGNVLRSAALHFETPNNRINAWTTARFRKLIRAIGADPDDPAMIEQGNSGELYTFLVPRASRSEVLAGNIFHAFLFLLSAGVLLVLWRSTHRTHSDTLFLAAGAVAAFILFSATVRWQPYNGRFHLPVFMLGCAVIATVLVARFPRLTVLAAALALLAALPYALSNQMRPLLGVRYFHGLGADNTPNIFSITRGRLYFGDQHLYLADSYFATANAVTAAGCRHVALDASLQHYDYPMLAALRAGTGGPDVHYIGVHNRSAIYQSDAQPAPCAIICLGCALALQKRATYAAPQFAEFQFDRNLLFLRKPLQDAPVTNSAKTSVLKTVQAASSDSISADSPPVEFASNLCSAIPEAAVRDLLSSPITHTAQNAACRYTGSFGQLVIAALPANSYYSQQYETLAAEGMGSLQFREPDHSLTIVLDRNVPTLAYLHKADATFSLNIDRATPPPTPDDYLRLAKALNTSLSQIATSLPAAPAPAN